MALGGETGIALVMDVDYSFVMSKSEILTELTKLNPAERREVLSKLLELEGEDWLDASDLTDEERRIIEERLEAHKKNPDAAIPWDNIEAELIERFGR